MTLHATRDGQAITIHGNTGVSMHMENSVLHHARITETAQHVRHFWGYLGTLLDEAEKATADLEQPAAAE